MFGNGQYVIPAKAGIQIPVWTLCQWQIMPSAKIYYDWYNTFTLFLFCHREHRAHREQGDKAGRLLTSEKTKRAESLPLSARVFPMGLALHR
jgi:hypothetical protein